LYSERTDDWDTAYVTGLTAYDERGEVILSADFTSPDDEIDGNPIFAQMIDTMGLHVVDVNFDGYKDVIILDAFAGAHSNSWYDCWLWDSERTRFAENRAFSDICNPAIDAVNECIYSAGGGGADDNTYYIYRFIDGEFVVANYLSWHHGDYTVETDPPSETLTSLSGIYIEEKKLVDGEMTDVRGGFIRDENVPELLAEFDDAPWQLGSPRWYMYGGHHADAWLDGAAK
jgi:hypothetical protein